MSEPLLSGNALPGLLTSALMKGRLRDCEIAMITYSCLGAVGVQRYWTAVTINERKWDTEE